MNLIFFNDKQDKPEQESSRKSVQTNICIRLTRPSIFATKFTGEDVMLFISFFAFQEILFPTEVRFVCLEFLLHVSCAIISQ